MLNSVQLLRAVAAWMVVFHHIVQVYYGTASDSWLRHLLYEYGRFGVDIFFVISGFVIYVSTRSKQLTPWQFMANRLIRIVPAYWFYTLLTALLLLAFKESLPFTGFSVPLLIKSMFFLPSENPGNPAFLPILTVGWTLNFEMMFYLVFSAALLFVSRYMIFFVALGLVCLQALLPVLGGALKFYGDTIAYEFLFGVIIGWAYGAGWMKKISLPLAIVIISMVNIVFISRYGKPFIEYRWLYIGLPSALMVMAVISQEHKIPAFKPLIHLGDWSYSTYLMHVMVLVAARNATITWGIKPLIAVSLACALIALLSYLSYTWIEQASSKFLKRRLLPKRSS